MISQLTYINTDIKFKYYITIYNKLVKYNIINITYMNLVNKYIIKNKCNKFLMNSRFIINKQRIAYKIFNKKIPN